MNTPESATNGVRRRTRVAVWLGLVASALVLLVTSAGPTEAQTGQGGVGLWSPVIGTPLTPVAASLLPDGDVLMWSAYERYTFGGDNGYTETAIFDPDANTSTRRRVSNTGHDMFCPGIANLADGRILVNGGSSSAETSLYDPATDSWIDAADMNIPRGYQGTTLLESGSALTLGGSWSGGIGGKHAEVWTSGSGWRRLAGVPVDPFRGTDPQGEYRDDNHLWLFGWSNGRVFHAGPSQAMHWIDANGNGSVTDVGNRGTDAFAINGNAVMYEPGRILTLGGAPAYVDGVATNNATLIDITGSSVTTETLPPMGNRRVFQNSVVLPSGEVVITGGQLTARAFTDIDSVLTTEIWNPETRTFTAAAPMTIPRNYHSFSLLLTDGRVLVGGGGLCGASCTANHPDVQIFTPPYLLDDLGQPLDRPTITTAPSSIDLGEIFDVTVDRAIDEVVLVRMASSTHSVNNDQRRIPLSFTAGQGANTYRVTAPADGGIAIPGSYMLFALDANGVPSVASTLIVTTDVAPPPTEATIAGQVATGGTGDAGVSIDLFAANPDGSRGAYLGTVTTDTNGNYSFTVQPGCYVLTFVAPAGRLFTNNREWYQPDLCVTGGQTATVDAELQSTTNPPATIQGQVSSGAGTPESGVAVDLFQANADGSRGAYLEATTTDAAGNYAFTAPGGCYVLTFIAPPGRTFTNNSQWYQSDACPASGATSTIDATLQAAGGPSATIDGQVVSAGGSPEAGIAIDLFAAAAGGGRGAYLASTTTDPSGNYSFPVDPGCYVLTFIAPPGRTFTNGSQWFQPNTCPPPGTTTINATLQ